MRSHEANRNSPPQMTLSPIPLDFYSFPNCPYSSIILSFFLYCAIYLSTFSSSPPLHQLRLDPRILFGLGNFSSASSHHKRIHPSIRYLCLAFFLYHPHPSPYAPKPILTSRQAVEPPSCLGLARRLETPGLSCTNSLEPSLIPILDAPNPPRGPRPPCRALHRTTASLRRNSSGIRPTPRPARTPITPMSNPSSIISIHLRLPLPSLPSRGARTLRTRPRCRAVYRRP